MERTLRFVLVVAIIVSSFLAFHADVVFTAEMNCYPQGIWCTKFEPNPFIAAERWEGYIEQNLYKWNPWGVGHYQYLNSGGFIGRVWALLRMTQTILDDIKQGRVDPKMVWYDGHNDQTYYMHYFLTYRDAHHVVLDYNASIFTTMIGTKHDAFVPGVNHTVYHRIFAQNICILHGNGPVPDEFMAELVRSCQRNNSIYSWISLE